MDSIKVESNNERTSLLSKPNGNKTIKTYSRLIFKIMLIIISVIICVYVFDIYSSNDGSESLVNTLNIEDNNNNNNINSDVTTVSCSASNSCTLGSGSTSCLSCISTVVNNIVNNWSAAKSRVKAVSSVSLTSCLKNKLSGSTKTISCINTAQCYYKQSSSIVVISKNHFWDELPGPCIASGACIAAALTNYLSNYYCLRSDKKAQDIGIGFNTWYTEKFGGTYMNYCPDGCDLWGPLSQQLIDSVLNGDI
eukprot:947934_1